MPRKLGSKDKQPRKRRGTALVAIKLSELNKTFNPDALVLVGAEFAKSLMLKNYTAVDFVENSNPTPVSPEGEKIQFTIVDPRQELEQQREVNPPEFPKA